MCLNDDDALKLIIPSFTKIRSKRVLPLIFIGVVLFCSMLNDPVASKTGIAGAGILKSIAALTLGIVKYCFSGKLSLASNTKINSLLSSVIMYELSDTLPTKSAIVASALTSGNEKVGLAETPLILPNSSTSFKHDVPSTEISTNNKIKWFFIIVLGIKPKTKST